MAENIEITNPDQLVPGDTVRFDFEILPQTNQAQLDLAIAEIKKAVATDDRFDYQGSKIQTVGDLELQRDVTLLSIFATVRQTTRATRQPIEYVQLTGFQATVMASVVMFHDIVVYLRTKVDRFSEGVQDALSSGAKAMPTLSLGILLIAGVIAYAFFFGVPKRSK